MTIGSTNVWSLRRAPQLPLATRMQLGQMRSDQPKHHQLTLGEVRASTAEQQESPVGPAVGRHRNKDVAPVTKVVDEERAERRVGVGAFGPQVRAALHAHVVAREKRTRTAVVLPELLPEHLKERVVTRTDGLATPHAVVGHAEEPHPLLPDVHELEAQAVARDEPV